MAVAIVYLAACIVLGGSSAAGILANASLQILAVIILAVIAFSDRFALSSSPLKPLLILALIFLLLAAVQAVPLPPSVWTALPGRDVVVKGFEQLGLSLPWVPFSLNPDATIASGLSILPPLAMIALLAPPNPSARYLPVAIIILGLMAMLVGVAQAATGEKSPLYFYAFTNRGSMVGFFANANHQMTLLLMALPFVAAIASPNLRGGQLILQDRIPKLVILASLFALMAGAVAIGGSRMGLALLVPVILFCIGMVVTDVTGKISRLWLASVAILMVVGGVGLFASGSILKQELTSAPGQVGSTRGVMWQRTADIVPEVMPAGSGLGSFVPLYRMHEPPKARTRTFANHAHNDYLEWALETGVAGILLLLAFFIWWGRRLVAVWRTPSASLGRAASVATAAVMLHSLVDYPIRTAAIAALVAVACALMAQEPKPADEQASSPRRGSRR